MTTHAASRRTGACPYCGDPLAGFEVNDDHVFVKALGGRAVVRVHKDCNSKLGSEVEGKLMRPGEQLNRKILRGHLRDDRDEPVDVDAKTGAVRFRRPVSVVDDPVADTRTYRIVEDREEARKRLKGQMGSKVGLSSEEADHLVDTAPPMSDPIDVVIELSFDLALARRLVAKVALGAIAVSAPSASASPLAEGLRRALWAEEQIEDLVDAAALAVAGDLAKDVGAVIEPLGPPSIATGHQPASRVVFVPMGRATAIFVYLGDALLSLSGIRVEHRCPLGSGLPVVVVDAKGGPQIRDVALELATHLAGR